MVDPIIDPATGKPKESETDPNAIETVPKADFDVLKQRLDSFEAGARSTQPSQPIQPATPTGPTIADQIGTLNTQIDAIDTKIDEAVQQQQPIAKLNKERAGLERQVTRLQIKSEDIDPAMSAGINTIDMLSDEITKGKMDKLSIPEVKQSYDAALSQLTPEQRMNPKMREAAYNMALGANIAIITEATKEATLRSNTQNQLDPSNANNAREEGKKGNGTTPKPEEILSKESISAMSTVGKTPDEYYKGMGYAGWNDFWEKRGKEYFGDAA